ncbi:unnamed protein product [Linum tenue]|uniref:Reticulon-like protein n=1 Tax=Linum tenue TaxID=586396 RepID=A0AAV0IJV9_9ROSI|nr:unnamed protein product [Linum tenue]
MEMEVPIWNSQNSRSCVVLGGQGFVGRSLVLRLLKVGNWIVRIADYAQSFHLDPVDRNDSLICDAISSGRASYHHIDVRDTSLIYKVINGSSTVFYLERSDIQQCDVSLCHAIIVQGARNVTKACRECKVRKLVYNSTADVVFDGSHDIVNVDESFLCHGKVEDALSDLKAQAEAIVLSANNIDGVLTCALRPSNIFGPRDTDLVWFWTRLAKYGLTKIIAGSGDKISDFTYVENVAHANICASEALETQRIFVGGKAFFITNEEPIQFWEFVSMILDGLRCPRPLIKLPVKVARYFLATIKWISIKLEFKKFNHLQISRVFNLSIHNRTFKCTAARDHIGYSPIVTLDEGISLTINSLTHLELESYLTRCGNEKRHSKAHKLLGSGKVAKILLWRDMKITLTWLLVIAFLFYWFLLSERTLISSLAKLLQLVTVILYFCFMAPIKMCLFTKKNQPASWFQNSESMAKDLVTFMTYIWNRAILSTKLLAQGRDWSRCSKILLSVYLGKILMMRSVTGTLGVAMIIAFTMFYVYEQYELQIDALTRVLQRRVKKLMIIENQNGPNVSKTR